MDINSTISNPDVINAITSYIERYQAWKSGDVIVYTRLNSPNVGDNVFNEKQLRTIFGTVDSKTSTTIECGGVSFQIYGVNVYQVHYSETAAASQKAAKDYFASKDEALDPSLNKLTGTGSSKAAGLSYPVSDGAQALTLGASGTEYTPTKDGWFRCRITDVTDEFGYTSVLEMSSTAGPLIRDVIYQGSGTNLGVAASVQATKGYKVVISYSHTGPNPTKTLAFYHAKGE